MTARDRAVVVALLAALAAGACATSPMPADGPASSATGSPQSGPLRGKTIVVDPGHNGGNADHPEVIDEQVDVLTGSKPCNTVGTRTDAGYDEHVFNFAVATRLTKLLEEAGATVVTTRDSDDGVGPCVDERAAIGNEADADAAVSIHADGGPADGRGFHILRPVLIEGHTEKIVGPSKKLAERIAATYAEATGIPPSDYIGDDGLNPRDDMGGLNLSTVPVVMVECGNMRNAKDAKLLSDEDFHDDIATGIGEGIIAFLD